jgi:hypothetical protein
MVIDLALIPPDANEMRHLLVARVMAIQEGAGFGAQKNHAV